MHPSPAVCLFCLIAFSALGRAEPPAPNFEWVATGGGAKSDKTRGVNADRDGNVYFTGEISENGKPGDVSDGQFGDHTLKAVGAPDFVVGKLDAHGHYLWVRLLGGSLSDRGYGVAPDAEGNVYATGAFQSTDLVVNGAPLPNAGDYDIFVVKYDRDGNLLWIKTAGGKGYDYGHGIAVDAHGNAYVTGAVVGDCAFGETRIPNDPGAHLFCAKYAPDGKLLWVKVSTGKAWSSGGNIAVDGAGNAIVAGSTSSVGALGGKPLNHPTPGSDTLLAKFTPDGEVAWISQGTGGAGVTLDAVVADADGRLWASGVIKGKAVFGEETFATAGGKNAFTLMQLYTPEGKLLWTRVGQTSGLALGLGVATDGRGHGFLTGEFTETLTLSGATLPSRGSVDIYVASFDESGALDWITQAGGKSVDSAYSIAWDPAGALIIGGACAAPTDFGDQHVQKTNGVDLYVAKLRVK